MDRKQTMMFSFVFYTTAADCNNQSRDGNLKDKAARAALVAPDGKIGKWLKVLDRKLGVAQHAMAGSFC